MRILANILLVAVILLSSVVGQRSPLAAGGQCNKKDCKGRKCCDDGKGNNGQKWCCAKDETCDPEAKGCKKDP